MKKHIYISIIIFSTIIFSMVLHSCTEVIQENLTESKITVNMPINNYTASKSYVQFWWNEVTGTNQYKLQIVSPKFDSISMLHIDSNVTGNKFDWSFTPGNYQWRIHAFNESSSSSFQTYNFTIDSSLDLSNNQIILVNPTNNIFTNSDAIHFDWIEEYSADYYYLKVTNSLDIPIINNFKVYTNDISVPNQNLPDNLAEGVYKWGIKAENLISSTKFTYSSFTIDRTKPNKPILIKPINNWVNNSDTVHFQWISGTDKHHSYDSIYVYLNSNIISLVKAYKSSSNSLTDTLSKGAYYWQTKSIDKAGNIGELSNLNKFKVN